MYRQRAILYSLGIHLTLLIIAYMGLPEFFTRKIESAPLVITLEPLPVTGKTNVKPSDKPLVKPRKEKPTPAKKQPEKKAAPEKKPPPKPPAAPEPDKKDVTPPKPKAPEKKADTPKPLEKEKPAEKKPEPETDPLDSVLKDVRKQAREGDETKKDDPKKESVPEANTTRSAAPYDPTLPLSLSERDAITSQFVQCWRIPAGAADDYTLKVSVDVSLRQNGSVISAALASDQRTRYQRDAVFRAAADSAVRAVHRCSPIQNLPTDKYNSWKEMRLNFDPSMQLY